MRRQKFMMAGVTLLAASMAMSACGNRAEEAPGATSFVHDLVSAAGGSISAEHGIGQMKAAELARLSSPARMAVLRGVKQALDPHGILNPGKLLLAPGTAP